MDIVTEKICSKCGDTKQANRFVKDLTKKDGLYSSCKDCYKKTYNEKHEYHLTRSKEYFKNNRNVVLMNKIKYRKKNRTVLLEKLKKWHDENKGREKEYREKNREKINLNSLLWYYQNKERSKKNLRQWRKNNPEKIHIQRTNRSTRHKQAEGVLKPKEWIALLDKYNNKCICCGATNLKLTVDHIVPISKGGKNTVDNIQPLCRSCNSSKGTKIIDYR